MNGDWRANVEMEENIFLFLFPNDKVITGDRPSYYWVRFMNQTWYRPLNTTCHVSTTNWLIWAVKKVYDDWDLVLRHQSWLTNEDYCMFIIMHSSDRQDPVCPGVTCGPYVICLLVLVARNWYTTYLSIPLSLSHSPVREVSLYRELYILLFNVELVRKEVPDYLNITYVNITRITQRNVPFKHLTWL